MQFTFDGEHFLSALRDAVGKELREEGGPHVLICNSDIDHHLIQLAEWLVKEYFIARSIGNA